MPIQFSKQIPPGICEDERFHAIDKWLKTQIAQIVVGDRCTILLQNRSEAYSECVKEY